MKKSLKILSLFLICILLSIQFNQFTNAKNNTENNFNTQIVRINIDPFSTIYEGDIINCTITGETLNKYWMINNQNKHTDFINNNPIIFDPEPTPLKSTYVNLTVIVETENGVFSDAVPIKLKRIYFGDLHWHTFISDGNYSLDEMYKNVIQDNYIDFTSCTDHGELIDGFNTKFGYVPDTDWIKTMIQKILRISEWKQIKEKAIEYYNPGNFSTILGFEWTAGEWSIGGKEYTNNGHEDVGHINFYYKDIYPEAPEYADWQKTNYDNIFSAMVKEREKGHLNIGFPHHSLGRASNTSFTTNFSFLANDVKNHDNRNKILRGAEIYSRWGTSIGQYYTPEIPWHWPYKTGSYYNQTEAWIENACWEWSKNNLKNKKFVFIASSDTHDINRPASANIEKSFNNPSGLVAVYSIHNTRNEIWDALNNGSCYALQLLKIRANVRFNGEIKYGGWINSSSPLEIRINTQSTFPGKDHSNKNMCPNGYQEEELNYPISDIWIIKKDTSKGQPWCKVIKHFTPNEHITSEYYIDYEVKPNDFYWIAIRQKGQNLFSKENQYIAFLGPFFINNVI